MNLFKNINTIYKFLKKSKPLTILSLSILTILLSSVNTFADVKIEVIRAAANTSTGTQGFTYTGFGTPKAALFIVTEGTQNGLAIHSAVFCMGATDGTRQRSACISSEHSVTTSDTYNRAMNDQTIFILNPTDGTVEGEADFDSWITDGIRIDWTNAPSARLVTVVLFGGSNLTAYVNDFTSSSTEDGTTDVTDPGFEPDQLITFGTRSAINDTSNSEGDFTLGIVDNGTTVKQYSTNISFRDAQGSSSMHAVYTDNYALWNVTTSLQGAIEIGSFDSDGFTSTTRTAADGNTAIYLALNYDGAVDHWAGPIDSAGSTGDESYTG